MAKRMCKCGDALGHAKAVEHAVFRALCNAKVDPEREDYWRNHADKLERKFITEHGSHIYEFTKRARHERHNR